MRVDDKSEERQSVRSSWRDLYPVHPCADVFPMLSDGEIDALATDIKKTGKIHQPIIMWTDNSSGTGPCWQVLDGRNRLAALESLGVIVPRPDDRESNPEFSTADGHTLRCRFEYLANCRWLGETKIETGFGILRDPAAFVISANIRRRHLTKEQQAELIVRTIEAGGNDSAKLARSFSPKSGRRGGSTKDPVLTAAIAEGNKHGIAKRTVERARAKVNGMAPVPPTEMAVSTVRRAGGRRSFRGRELRLKQLRTLAASGHTSRQMASRVKLTVAHCRRVLRQAQIDVPADRTVGRQGAIDSNRVVERMAWEADHYTADVNLIDFDELDRSRIAEWVARFHAGWANLGPFIRQLQRMQPQHDSHGVVLPIQASRDSIGPT